MLTSHLRTAGAQTDNVGKRSVTFYHRGDPGNAHWVTLNWLAARVCKAPFGSTVGGPKLFRPESDWFVWMFVLNCVSRMKQAGGHVWFLELIFSLSGSEGDSHLAAPSLHLTISNIYCDCGSRMTAKDNYTDYICTQCVASTRRHTHTHLHADAAADWKEEISVFLGFIPGVYRGLWCTGGGALEMSWHRSQLRGPLWVHSEGSKQERGPPVRLHSGRQIGMILEVMKLWSREREDAFGSDEKTQPSPLPTLWACQRAWKSICNHSHAGTSPKTQNSSVRKKNGGEEGDNQQQSACVSDGRVTGPSGRTG